MDSEISLKKLIKVSIKKKSPPKVFLDLVKQWLEKGDRSDNEILESLIELHPSLISEQEQKSLQLHYAIQLACSSLDEHRRFMKLLPQSTLDSQRDYILYLRNNLKSLFLENMMREFINGTFVEYSKGICERMRLNLSATLKRLWAYILFLWGTIIDHYDSFITVPVFKDLGIHIVGTLKDLGDSNMLAYFSNKANSIINPSELHKDVHLPIATQKHKTEVPSIASMKRALALNGSSKKIQHYFKLKKFIWLNSRFRLWELNDVVEKYFLFFKILTQKIEDVIKEIFSAFFGGITTAIHLHEDAFVIFNWKTFIVSRLPQVLKESKVVHNQTIPENIEEMILSEMHQYNDEVITKMTVGGMKDKPFDLRKQFLKSCVYSRVISLDAMLKIFPEETENVSPALITHEREQLAHVESLSSDINSRLLDINTELTSLEESKLIETFQNIPSSNIIFLIMKQQQLCKLIHRAIDVLIREKSCEKLSRLILALANVLPVANYIFYNDEKGPWGILDKLISFLDGESFGVDADDSSFQDTYAHFGILLAGVLLLTSNFGIDFDNVCIETSYTVTYINRIFFRLAGDMTDRFEGEDEQEKNIVQNYYNLMGDWLNALFDVNNEGLSDDLIKSVGVKQIYKLIPIIFQLAIKAKLVGALGTGSLNNGIDYLSQDFLAPCCMEIMHWVTSKLGPMQASNDVIADALLRIIESNIGPTTTDSEHNFTFRMVLHVVGPAIIRKIRTIKEWLTNEKLTQLISVIRKETDPEYCMCDGAVPEVTGGPTLAESVRKTLLHYTLDTSTDSAPKCWSAIRYLWAAVPKTELVQLLLQELDRGSKSFSNPVTTEEARITADFLVFMVIDSSRVVARDTIADISQFNDSSPLSEDNIQYQFKLALDSHYASVFNEANTEPPKENKPVPKEEEIPDVDMDDLFNDVGEDLFGDFMQVTLSHIDKPTVYRTAAIVSDCYTRVWRFMSLNVCMLQLQSDSTSPPGLINMARLLISHELEHWLFVLKS